MSRNDFLSINQSEFLRFLSDCGWKYEISSWHSTGGFKVCVYNPLTDNKPEDGFVECSNNLSKALEDIAYHMLSELKHTEDELHGELNG